MRESFFSLGSQNFYLVRLIGALAIIVGFALLIGSVLNASDSWRALKDYPVCLGGVSMDSPDYAQLRLGYCQEAVYNMTGVQFQVNQPIGKSQQAQVLLNSIIKICFGIVVIFFGVWLYRPFPRSRDRFSQTRPARKK